MFDQSCDHAATSLYLGVPVAFTDPFDGSVESLSDIQRQERKDQSPALDADEIKQDAVSYFD